MEVSALFDNHPRRKNKALLLGITIVNPCTSSNLENVAHHAGKYLADAVERKKQSIGARPPLPTPPFLSLCRRVVRLAQACMPSSRHLPSDRSSTGRRHTPTSPSIWRRRRKKHVFGGDSLLFYSRHFYSSRVIIFADSG